MHAGLWVQASERDDDGVLDAFFGAYDAAFVLADEKEEIGGFRDCLALNAGAPHAEVRRRYGQFRELVLVARAAHDGPVVGGANLIVLQHGAGTAVDVTVNLNYLFVAAEQRGRGHSRALLGACRALAAAVARPWRPDPASDTLFFLELNDPFRLTPEQYRLDSAHAGIDQIDRLRYWAHVGAAVLDWPYVQPALSAQQRDDATLALAVLDAPSHALPAALLHGHLERFFAISVLKGRPLRGSASAVTQLERLRVEADGGAIALLDLGACIDALPALLARTRSRPERLSAALREAGT